MARPYQGYKLNGKKCVGTTTILGSFGDKGALIHSANRLGLQGKSIKEEWYTKAANIGTLAHDLFEAYINPKIEPPELTEYDSESIEKANIAFGSAKEWFKQSNLEIIDTEVSYVSEIHQFGGTIDAIGRSKGSPDNEVHILDWKTGGVFGSALFQVSAYSLLVEEFTDYKVTGFHVVRFSKDFGDFTHRYFPELNAQKNNFPALRKIYSLLKETEKRAR